MHYTREAAIERLLRSFSSCYNIQLVEDDQTPITARCDFFEHSGQYVISKKAELWSADNEEFLYVLSIPHLTLELYEQWRDHVQAEAMERIHVGPGHMASYITPIFICDTCDEAARKALKVFIFHCMAGWITIPHWWNCRQDRSTETLGDAIPRKF